MDHDEIVNKRALAKDQGFADVALTRMNAPQGHSVQIIQHKPGVAQISTEKIRAAIDRIGASSCPSRSSAIRTN